MHNMFLRLVCGKDPPELDKAKKMHDIWDDRAPLIKILLCLCSNQFPSAPKSITRNGSGTFSPSWSASLCFESYRF